MNLTKIKSLKKETEKVIKYEYPQLFISNKQEWAEKIVSEQSYIYIGCIIIFFFVLIIIKNYFPIFDILNIIPLTRKTVEALLENRISNIATMVGFSLSIATFLISNVEKKAKENREVLIKKTYLYPTLYLSLVILFFYIIISFFKEAIPDNIFLDLVLYLHCLVACLIAAIINLFKNIIHIFNPNFTDIWLQENIILSLKKSLKRAFLEEISRNLFDKFIDEINAKNLDKDPRMGAKTSNTQNLTVPENQEVADVNLFQLEKIIIKYSNTKIYPSLRGVNLYMRRHPYWPVIIFKIEGSNKPFQKAILNCFKFKKPYNEIISLRNYLSSLKKWLLEALKKGNEEDFDTIFSFYEIIFDTYFDATKSKNGNSQKDQSGYKLLLELQWDIQEILKESINQDKEHFFSKISGLIERVIYCAFINRQITPFADYLKVYTELYPILLFNISCGNSYLRNHFGGMSMIHDSFLNSAFMDTESIEDKRIINTFFNRFYNYYAQISYNILSVYFVEEDLSSDISKRIEKHFAKMSKSLHKIIELYNRTYSRSVPKVSGIQEVDLERLKLGIRTQFALKSWILNLYRGDNISEISCRSLLEKLNFHIPYDFHFINEAITLINPNNRRRNEGIYLDDWEYVPDPTSSFIIRGINTEYWLKFGLVVELLHDKSMLDVEFDIIPIDSPLRHYQKEITEILIEIKNNSNKWENIIGFHDLPNLDISIDKISVSLEKIQKRYQFHLYKVHASQELSPKRIESFKNGVREAWNKDSKILQIFKYFNATKPILEDNTKLEYIGINTPVKDLKKSFVAKESDDVYGLENIGSEIGRFSNEYFLNAIVKDLEIPKFPTPNDAIKRAIMNLKGKNIEPNVIIMSSRLIYDREFDKDNTNFVYNFKLKEEEKSPIGEGLFDNIPVIAIFSKSIENKIIVANLNRAFKLEILENPQWIDKQLFVNIKSFTLQEATNEYNKEPKKWEKDRQGNELSQEDAINYISNTLQIEVFSKLRLDIVDRNAFDVIAY